MSKAFRQLKILSIVLLAVTLVGLVVDYNVDSNNFPAEFTLFPLCLLITCLLVMLVMWLFQVLTQNDR